MCLSLFFSIFFLSPPPPGKGKKKEESVFGGAGGAKPEPAYVAGRLARLATAAGQKPGSGVSSPGADRGALGSSGWGSATENTATHAFGLHRLPLRVFPLSRLHVQGLAARSRPLTSAPCLPLRPATFTYIKEIRALKKYANPSRRGTGAFLERSPFTEAFN